MKRVVLFGAIIAASINAGGCCGLVYPSGKQVNAWLAKELPPGSSQDQAWGFFVRRGFHVVIMSTPVVGKPQHFLAVKTVGTCLLVGWDEINVEVALDDYGRVKSAQADQAEWWP